MNLFNAAYNYAMAHPAQFLALWTALTGGVQYFFGVFAQSLRTPTDQSSQGYVSFFQLVNAAAANWHRAGVPQPQNSPNFEAAVEAYLQKKAAMPQTSPATVAAVTQIQNGTK